MFKGLTLKIWLPFSLVLLTLAISFFLYYPSKLERYYQDNKNNELKELAKTVGLGVELSLNEDNYLGLKKTLDFAADRSDFEFIAIVLNDQEDETVFASYPDSLSESEVLKKNPEKYIYQRSNFSTPDFHGYISIAASKKKMAIELSALNRPILLSTILVFFITFFIYIALARRITRPINDLVRITNNMQNDRFTDTPSLNFSNDEIGQLGVSIHDLQSKLIEQRAKNKELYEGLEDQINSRTQELELATKNLIESQETASIANYLIQLSTGRAFFPELFFLQIGRVFCPELSLEELAEYIHPDDTKLFLEITDNRPVNSNFRKDIRCINSSGQIIWFSLTGYYKQDELSTDLVLRGLLQDITERKNYESEINRLSLVAKNTSNCVIITDANKKMVWVNESAEKTTGYSRDELIGQSPKMFQFEKTDPVTIQYMSEKLAKHEAVHCEILNRSKQGREYWLDLNIVPLFDDRKVLYGYIAVETDITPIIEASIELEEREKQLRNILDNSSEMIHTLDVDGNVIWANKSWKENLQVSDIDLENRNIAEFLDPATKIEFSEVMTLVMNGKDVKNLDCGFHSMDGELLHLKGQTIPLYKDGKLIGSQAYLHNVTQIVKAENELKTISHMQEMVLEISFDFLNVDPIAAKEIITASMLRIGSYFQAESIKTVNLMNDQSILSHHLNLTSSKENDQELMNPNLKDMALPTFSSSKDILIPLLRNNTSIGDLMISIPANKTILTQEFDLLKLYATMLVNVENRYFTALEISKAKHEIELSNSSLETKVLENTKRNIELSKTIVEQEKMATIGEISAGIAHDLNTPLGAIKAGVESINYSIDSIFKLIPNLSREEAELMMSIARTRKIGAFVGGLQLRRETKEMIEHLNLGNQHTKVQELLVKCHIQKHETQLIQEILMRDNPEMFLEALLTVQVIYSMLSSVGDSAIRATQVVQNIRAFIKKDVSSGLKRARVNLFDNIQVVLNIFNYEFKKNINLIVDVDPNLSLNGFDVKLFQLWSNLIKNALDAMENIPDKTLMIKGVEENSEIKVMISNNGASIPKEMQQHIFKKFFSTKSKNNGTGLGLSIVQNVVNEHHARITLESTEELTTFCIVFPIEE
jgi:PAS domain S-box-containing protein